MSGNAKTGGGQKAADRKPGVVPKSARVKPPAGGKASVSGKASVGGKASRAVVASAAKRTVDKAAKQAVGKLAVSAKTAAKTKTAAKMKAAAVSRKVSAGQKFASAKGGKRNNGKPDGEMLAAKKMKNGSTGSGRPSSHALRGATSGAHPMAKASGGSKPAATGANRLMTSKKAAAHEAAPTKAVAGTRSAGAKSPVLSKSHSSARTSARTVASIKTSASARETRTGCEGGRPCFIRRQECRRGSQRGGGA